MGSHTHLSCQSYRTVVWDMNSDVAVRTFLAQMLYDVGSGPVDTAEARVHLKKAADQGHVEAQYCLARMLLGGEGGPADRAEARVQYKKAADHAVSLHRAASLHCLVSLHCAVSLHRAASLHCAVSLHRAASLALHRAGAPPGGEHRETQWWGTGESAISLQPPTSLQCAACLHHTASLHSAASLHRAASLHPATFLRAIHSRQTI